MAVYSKKYGITLACFHSVMNLPDCKDLFRMFESEGAINGAVVLRSLPGSLSKPTALFSDILFSCCSTKSGVTGGNLYFKAKRSGEGLTLVPVGGITLKAFD